MFWSLFRDHSTVEERLCDDEQGEPAVVFRRPQGNLNQPCAHVTQGTRRQSLEEMKLNGSGWSKLGKKKIPGSGRSMRGYILAIY